jgi:MoaA/NifB/PqqE/SkfB family radical SAM enzyme
MGNQFYDGTSVLGIENIEDLTPEEIFYHPRMTELRNNLANGVRDSACQICWRMEDDGITSHRQHSLENDEEPIYDPNLEILDITTGNICNLKCRMCNPGASNLLMEDHKYFEKNNLLEEFYAVAGERWDVSTAKATHKTPQWEWILDNMHKIKILKASGGEPFYDKHILNLLKRCVEKGISNNVSLRFHTNGTQFNEKVLNLISHFHNQHTLSIDGVGSVYEYIRYPASFSDLNNKVIYYLQYLNYPDIKIDLNFVVSSLNLFNIADFIRWACSLPADVSASFTEIYPLDRGTSIRHLPIDILQIAKLQIQPFLIDDYDDFKADEIIQQIDLAIKNNKEDKDKMKREIVLFDISRNQTYRDYLDPMLVDWLDT